MMLQKPSGCTQRLQGLKLHTDASHQVVLSFNSLDTSALLPAVQQLQVQQQFQRICVGGLSFMSVVRGMVLM